MEMQKGPFCQFCGLPFEMLEGYGTNADGSKSEDYCQECFQNGNFTHPDVTMEQMIERATELLVQLSFGSLTEEQAKKEAEKHYPTLKRWKSK